MKTKIFFLVLILSFSGLIAQEKEVIKMQSADEKGFIQVDKAPALISQLKPEYPREAKLQDIQGKVLLKLLIDEKGNVAKAKLEKSVNPLLDKSALSAAKKAKFSPAMVKDKPVKVWVVLPVSFKLDEKLELTEEEKKWKSNPANSKYPAPDEYVAVKKLPDIISAATPDYPSDAKKNNIEGKVYVKVLVDNEGNPKEAIVIRSDNEIFNQPAKEAAMKTKFSPAMQDGKPTAVWVVLPYRFALDGKEKK
jgi:TonB family protein